MNIQGITLGDLGDVIIWIGAVLGAGTLIARFSVKHLGKIVNEALENTNKRLDTIEQTVRQVDVDNTKNYLQQTISAVNDGAKLDDPARERFYENYDHYTNDLHLNSWVHKAVEKLEKEGKL